MRAAAGPLRPGLLAACLVILALAPAGCGAAGPTASASPATASPPRMIHVLEDPIEWTGVPAGKLTGCATATGCQGDELIGRSRMLEAATQKEVGTFFGDCFLIDPGLTIYDCPANTITLAGRGQIVYTETPFCFGSITASPDCRGDWPIIGGTGEFLGATGVVDVPPDTTWKYGDFVITFTK